MTILGQASQGGKNRGGIRLSGGHTGPVKRIAKTVWTGDETMDYLINSK